MAPRNTSQKLESSETVVRKVNSKSVKTQRLPKTKILDFIRDTIESGEYSEVVTWVDQNKTGFQILDPKSLVELYSRATGKPETKFDNLCRPLRRLTEEGVLFKPKEMRSTWYFVKEVLDAALAEAAIGTAPEEIKEEFKKEELMEADENSELQVTPLEMLLKNCEEQLQ